MNPKLEGQIYNYRTGQHDPLAEGELFTLDDEKLADYVPQMGGRGMYMTLRKMGHAKSAALLYVLHRAVGEDYPLPQLPEA